MGRVRRATYGLVASLLVTTIVLQIVRPGVAYAYGQITIRSISMSSSQPGDAGESYLVDFRAGTAGAIKSIAVDFCANSPIIGDACTAAIGTSTPTLTAVDPETGPAGGNINAGDPWTHSLTNGGRTYTISSATGITVNAGDQISFTIPGVTNPTALGTFYARILTFTGETTTNAADAYAATNLGTNIPTDAGGIALSTANQITITAKVQERIVFCVYVVDAVDVEDAGAEGGNNCTAKDGSDVTLGDQNGVLDTPYPFVDKRTRYTVSTNASTGVKVRVKGITLTSGTNEIDANAIPTTSAAGSEQFGLCTYELAFEDVPGQLDPADDYDGGPGSECSGTSQTSGTSTGGGHNGAEFTFKTSGTTSTYGEEIATKAAGDFSTGTVVLIGNVSNSTEAGIYKTTLMFIATGVF